ncbi:alginate export family protein [Cyclobacterium jeungdonense]|uniref:Alginate export family protein n=1 Tax=Cyclobacterium jeungdonense TaxID=708087 RepID=A0ABT8CAN3_9BACT|nr:alginate export family protein [Cyclobacterium jeungdonense]MDN3688741.1 alginate export family protein [Cyclobacterium jeungdonense]
MKNRLFLILLPLCYFSISPLLAQFTVDGQLIQRAEYRNGYSRLINSADNPAGFIAQRARIQASYVSDAVTIYMSLQDIRTWGNTSQVKASDNLLSVHEAYAELSLGEFWKAKLGRQELNYDNFRFLGNLDWALQGRAHDFALVKYEKNEHKLHLGAGYNQDGQNLSGNLFTVPNQYKFAQLARYENRWDNFQFSFLFWNDGRQFIERNNLGEIILAETQFRQTIGIPTLKYQVGNTLFSGFYYQQLGKWGNPVSAFDINLQVTQTFDFDAAEGKIFRLAGGFEMLSGTSSEDHSKNRSFSPLYGTNHLYNGYMDLFYVGGTHENNVGLKDYYLKGRMTFSPRFFMQLDGHWFNSQAEVLSLNQNTDPMDSHLGKELDLSLGYVFNDAISLQGGYSQFFATETMERIQNNGSLKASQNWAYLMLIVRPTMKNKFIGILL